MFRMQYIVFVKVYIRYGAKLLIESYQITLAAGLSIHRMLWKYSLRMRSVQLNITRAQIVLTAPMNDGVKCNVAKKP